MLTATPEPIALNIHYRQATPADLPSMLQIRRRVLENPENPASPMPAEVRLAALLRGGCQVSCAGDRVVGFVQAIEQPPMIGGLYVDPEFEGRGIGKQLLRLAVQHLRAAGVASIWLSTVAGTRAERLYQSAGWRRSGQSANEVEYILMLE
ncbi:MAG: N-acetyltransferase [Lysobacterales bacterium CG02_land_8_20_14_3_00_62_12]|nr:MAG: N-acetyltransferase [Xanthomonadales bacterium CG02_land_8_20_14_3_00_62_12]